MKDVCIKLFVLCISMVIGLLLCEGLIRLIAPQRLDFVRKLYDPDDSTVFKLRKNLQTVHSQFEFNVVETTNSIGLRDREIGSKSPGSLRILALGDSYGYGHGVDLEETYVKQLESSLNASTDRMVEVINAGVPAYSLAQEIRYLEKYGLDLEPDVVLVGFYIGNDFIDSYELYDAGGTPTIAVSDHMLVSRKGSDAGHGIMGMTQPIRSFLAPNSHLYVFLRNRFSEVLRRLGLRHIGHITEFCAKEFTPEMQEQWQHTQQLLLELSALTRAHGKQLVIVPIPLIYQVHQDIWNEYTSIFQIDPTRFDMEKPQRLLTDFCTQQNIDCVDVLDTMRRQGETTPLFYRVDGHMTAAGHRVVAQVLTPYFTTLLNTALSER